MSSTDVVIAHHERIEDAICAALEHVPLSSLIRGKRVAVKPNETWASEDDTIGITQPDTLRAVLQAIKRHQPLELVVTGGAGAAETDEVVRIGGLMDVVEAEGAEFVDHNRAPFVSVELEYRPSAEVEGPQAAFLEHNLRLHLVADRHPEWVTGVPQKFRCFRRVSTSLQLIERA